MEVARQPVISMRDVVIGFSSNDVITDFNLDVNRGEIVTLFGPSGCGKSTLIKALAGMILPRQGTVRIDGTIADQYNLPIAYTPQQNELLPWKTVFDNVKLWHNESHTKINGKDSVAPDHALQWVEMDSAANKLPAELSGGMERRTAIARCIATQSEIMLLDEAFVSIESRLRKKLMKTLRDYIKSRGITALLISHDYEEAVFMSDRVIVLSASPTSILKDIRIGLPQERPVDLFGTQKFMEHSLEVIH